MLPKRDVDLGASSSFFSKGLESFSEVSSFLGSSFLGSSSFLGGIENSEVLGAESVGLIEKSPVELACPKRLFEFDSVGFDSGLGVSSFGASG